MIKKVALLLCRWTAKQDIGGEYDRTDRMNVIGQRGECDGT